jgi:Arc/MetJ-type ribon-helix-helix transcriptional regulator
MPRGRVVKGVVRSVRLRVGARNLTFRSTEGIEEMLAYLVRRGYFITASEAVRHAIVHLYLEIRRLEEAGEEGRPRPEPGCG